MKKKTMTFEEEMDSFWRSYERVLSQRRCEKKTSPELRDEREFAAIVVERIPDVEEDENEQLRRQLKKAREELKVLESQLEERERILTQKARSKRNKGRKANDANVEDECDVLPLYSDFVASGKHSAVGF